jgi:head-tail adaptor
MTVIPNYIQAGKLRHRITILDLTVGVPGSQTPSGGIIPGPQPTPIAEDLPAAIEFVSAKETYSGDQFISQVTHRVTIRWKPGIRANQQIYFTDAEGRQRTFRVLFIDNPDERNKMLILSCLETDESTRQI